MPNYAKKGFIWLWYFLASLIILFAVVGSLVKALTPVLNDHIPTLEKTLEKYLHQDVTIGSVNINWATFGPEFHFNDIIIYNEKKVLVKADELMAHIGIWRSLFKRSLFLRSFTLDGVDLDVVEVTKHKYSINGFGDFDIDATNVNNPLVAWLSWQRHMQLSNIHLHYSSIGNNTVNAELRQLSYRSSDDGFSLAALLSLKNDARHPIKLVGRFSNTLEKFTQLNGTVYVSYAGLPLSYFKKYLLEEKLSATGKANLQAWLHIKDGGVTSVTSQLSGKDWQISDPSETLSVNSIGGLFQWQSTNKGWQFVGNNIDVATDEVKWDQVNLQLLSNKNAYDLSANYLNAGDLLRVELFMENLPQDVKSFLLHIKPSGVINDLSLHAPHDLTKLSDYRISAMVNNLKMSAYKAYPELNNIDAEISGSLSDGEFDVTEKDAVVAFPAYFEQAFVVRKGSFNGEWHYSDEHLQFILQDIDLRDDDFDVDAEMALDVPVNDPMGTQINIMGGFNFFDSTKVKHYLPLKIFSPAVSEWISNAIVSGENVHGTTVMRGSARDFPYKKHEGTFYIDSFIEPVTFNYDATWPAINNLSADLVFRNSGMHIKTKSGDTDGIKFESASADIADLSHKPVLKITGKTHESSNDVLEFIHQSPLDSTVGQWLKPFDVTGPLAMLLELTLPLTDEDAIEVNGQLEFLGDTATWVDAKQSLTHVNGKLNFDNKSNVSAKAIKAVLEGGNVLLDVNTSKEKSIPSAVNLDFSGVMTDEQIAKISKQEKIKDYIDGQSAYSGQVTIPYDGSSVDFNLSTGLIGMAVSLPDNLGKEKQESKPLMVNGQYDFAKALLQIALDYKKSINAVVKLEETADGLSDISLNMQLPSFTWPFTSESTSIQGDDNATSALKSRLKAIELKVGQLNLYGNNLSAVVVAGKRTATGQSWIINSEQAKGQLMIENDSKLPIKATFNYIVADLPKSEKKTKLDIKQVQQWPSLDLSINRLTINKKFYGLVKLKTSLLEHGVQIDQLVIDNLLYGLTINGSWQTQGADTASQFKGEFSSQDFGNFLAVSKITSSLKAKKADAAFDLSWPGSPLDYDLKTMTGTAKISVDDGVIPMGGNSVQMGLGKVLSAFSAQSIERRLKLDFSDIDESGYSFNTMESNVALAEGDAQFSKGEFDGPQAKITFDGGVGITAKDYDINLVVMPYITSTLPIIATLIGGPIAGAATYAVDKIASKGIDQLTSYRYLLNGTWADPKLLNLDAKSDE
jgi:uncharacterized protein (TIGR02099 family)